jgi:hypothetical protein
MRVLPSRAALLPLAFVMIAGPQIVILGGQRDRAQVVHRDDASGLSGEPLGEDTRGVDVPVPRSGSPSIRTPRSSLETPSRAIRSSASRATAGLLPRAIGHGVHLRSRGRRVAAFTSFTISRTAFQAGIALTPPPPCVALEH